MVWLFVVNIDGGCLQYQILFDIMSGILQEFVVHDAFKMSFHAQCLKFDISIHLSRLSFWPDATTSVGDTIVFDAYYGYNILIWIMVVLV